MEKIYLKDSPYFMIGIVVAFISLMLILTNYPFPENTPDIYALLSADDALTFEGALRLAEAVDKYKDAVLEQTPDLPKDIESLHQLTHEIVPFFYYEGIRGLPGEVYPTIQWMKLYNQQHFSVSGRASCSTSFASVWLNLRYANPLGPNYRSKATIYSTLVHELSHVNGICDATDPLMEPTNQLATLEVLAAMATYREQYALAAFLSEIQGFAEDYAYAVALQDDRLDEFIAHVERTGDNFYSEASFQKSLKYWENDMDTLKRILNLYGKTPFILLVDATDNKNYSTKRLDSFINPTHKIFMDDTMYLLQHIEEFVHDYPEIIK